MIKPISKAELIAHAVRAARDDGDPAPKQSPAKRSTRFMPVKRTINILGIPSDPLILHCTWIDASDDIRKEFGQSMVESMQHCLESGRRFAFTRPIIGDKRVEVVYEEDDHKCLVVDQVLEEER